MFSAIRNSALISAAALCALAASPRAFATPETPDDANYTFATAQPMDIEVQGDGLGQAGDTSNFGFFMFSVNTGDNLTIILSTTPAQLTMVNLYDPNRNLVAEGSGNGADGLSSIVQWTGLFNGDYVVSVSIPNSTSSSVPIDFDLLVEGATGVPLPLLPVPEPASLAMFGASLAMFGLMRRKRETS